MDDRLLVRVLDARRTPRRTAAGARRCERCWVSQCSVIGTPATYSMTKYGRPSGVLPPSKTRAMAGWSIIASAWRSDSNRATTSPGVHPRLDDLQGHLAPDGLGLLGEPDLAHPALAEPLEQPVRPDPFLRASFRCDGRGCPAGRPRVSSSPVPDNGESTDIARLFSSRQPDPRKVARPVDESCPERVGSAGPSAGALSASGRASAARQGAPPVYQCIRARRSSSRSPRPRSAQSVLSASRSTSLFRSRSSRMSSSDFGPPA